MMLLILLPNVKTYVSGELLVIIPIGRPGSVLSPLSQIVRKTGPVLVRQAVTFETLFVINCFAKMTGIQDFWPTREKPRTIFSGK